eukprot:15485673-Alexandrium_andersonii.AAC.1
MPHRPGRQSRKPGGRDGPVEGPGEGRKLGAPGTWPPRNLLPLGAPPGPGSGRWRRLRARRGTPPPWDSP